MNEKMTGPEFEVLDQWFEFATKSNNYIDINVDLIIYLRTSPEKVQ